MRNASFFKLMVFMSLLTIGANFIHPVTPSLLSELNMPSYMFGVLFAAMAVTNFLFSPLWGRLSDIHGRSVVIGVTSIGYAVGQYFFSIATTQVTLILARLFSGIFTGGYMVAALAFVVDLSPDNKLSKNITIQATMFSVMTAVGYLIGGVLGDYSISFVFQMQVLVLLISGVLFLTLMKEKRDIKMTQNLSWQQIKTECNPLSAFKQSAKLLDATLMAFLVAVFLTSFATTSYDNAFNYYIKDILNFPASYNGMIKAFVGLLSLLANLTVCMWLIKHTDVKKSYRVVLLICSGTLLSVCFTNTPLTFVFANIVFYVFNAIYIPIQQTLLLQMGEQSNGLVSGIYNSIKGMGMVVGALFAGFIYMYGSKLPFIFGSVAFLMAMVACVVKVKQSQGVVIKTKQCEVGIK